MKKLSLRPIRGGRAGVPVFTPPCCKFHKSVAKKSASGPSFPSIDRVVRGRTGGGEQDQWRERETARQV